MQLNNLARHTKLKRARTVGRGGKRGKTSGRGTKGQKARAGRKIRPELRDLIKKLPKRRGFGKNRSRTVNTGRVRPAIVTVAALARAFPSGGVVTPRALVARRLVRRLKGRIPPVKILGEGALPAGIVVKNCSFSASAAAAGAAS